MVVADAVLHAARKLACPSGYVSGKGGIFKVLLLASAVRAMGSTVDFSVKLRIFV